MTPGARRAAAGAALLALLGLGCALRVFRWSEAPPGPWIDEALALRAAREAVSAGAPLAGTTPLQPPDAGFVNSWLTNLSLYGLAAIDRTAGGGIASVRAMSVLPSLVLLLGIVAVAAEASAGRLFPVLVATLVGSTSSWLLVTGRWGWNAVATSAVVTAAAWCALRAARTGSVPLGAAAGGLSGLALWGYVAAWALAPLPPLLFAAAFFRRDGTPGAGGRLRAAAAGLAACLLVAAPLLAHYAAHPERALARPRELSAGRAAGGALPALVRNAGGYARLFAVGGDPNERHGDPGRPVLPVAVTVLALAAAAGAFRRPGPERLLALVAALFLCASLLAVEESPNAYRAVHAAPFLVVLAALGAARLAELAGPARRAFATTALSLVLVATSILDAAGFLRWLSSPRLYGAFGGPERDLADAVAAETGARGAADVLLSPGASRNAFVVDALLRDPRSAVPAIRQVSGLGSPRYVPSRDVLYADAQTAEGASGPEALGGAMVASGGRLPGFSGWSLWRVPAERAAAAARASLEAFPFIPAPGTGGLLAREEGLYTFSSRGGVEAMLDGGVLFDASRPAGAFTARLGAGRHDLRVAKGSPGAVLRVTGPDGFVLPAP